MKLGHTLHIQIFIKIDYFLFSNLLFLVNVGCVLNGEVWAVEISLVVPGRVFVPLQVQGLGPGTDWTGRMEIS